MAVVKEDGTIVAGANSYIDATDLSDYMAARGLTLTGTAATLIIQAMDVVDQNNFIGTKYSATQTTQWPRSGAYVDGYLLDENYIPVELMNAQCEAVIAIDTGYDTLAVSTPSVKSKQVGDIQVVYQDGASSQSYSRKINNFLKKLLAGGGGSNTFKVTRA